MSERTLSIGWLEIALALSTISLICQVYPPLFWLPLAYLDVRQWGWKTYTTLFAVMICVLIYLKSRQDQ